MYALRHQFSHLLSQTFNHLCSTCLTPAASITLTLLTPCEFKPIHLCCSSGYGPCALYSTELASVSLWAQAEFRLCWGLTRLARALDAPQACGDPCEEPPSELVVHTSPTFIPTVP